MDTQLVAEKLFKFCKEKYPDLKWIFHKLNYDQYHQTIQGVTDLTDSPEIEILLKVGGSGSVDEYSEYSEGLYVKGWCALNSLDWVDEFIVLLNSWVLFLHRDCWWVEWKRLAIIQTISKNNVKYF